jgi:hypothetical protein
LTGPRHADRPPHTATSPHPEAPAPNPDALEVAPGRQRETIEGSVPTLASESELREALEKAFDYRGDVTLTTKDGKKIEGYIFDRISGPALASSFVRLMPANSTDRLKISYADIAALAFSGRDTAAGKSWEAWVRKYWEKKSAGQSGLSLQPDSLE